MDRDKVVVYYRCPRCDSGNVSHLPIDAKAECLNCIWRGKEIELLEYHALPKEDLDKLLDENERFRKFFEEIRPTEALEIDACDFNDSAEKYKLVVELPFDKSDPSSVDMAEEYDCEELFYTTWSDYAQSQTSNPKGGNNGS